MEIDRCRCRCRCMNIYEYSCISSVCMYVPSVPSRSVRRRRCGFCALCLEDCGDDAHKHLASCGEILMVIHIYLFVFIEIDR